MKGEFDRNKECRPRIVTGNAGESSVGVVSAGARLVDLLMIEPSILDGDDSSQAHGTLRIVWSHFSYCVELYLNFTA